MAMRISRLEVQMVHNEIIQKLSIAAESRDTETGLHVLRMGPIRTGDRIRHGLRRGDVRVDRVDGAHA